jgi:hypothetical protein
MITDEQAARTTVMVKTLESMDPEKRYALLRQVAAEGGLSVSITLKNRREDIDIRPVDVPTALEQAEADRIAALQVAEKVPELEADLAYVRSELARVIEQRDDARKYAARLIQDAKDHDLETEKEWSKKNKDLADQIVELERSRDGWRSEYEMYAKAWARELGPMRRKTHLIDQLVVATKEMRERLEAAEKVCELAKNYRPDLDQFRLAFLDAYEAWKKAKGEK